MTKILFVSDLHGRISWYEKLLKAIEAETPDLVLMGGDLLPHPHKRVQPQADFIDGFLQKKFSTLKTSMGSRYPSVMLIMGNDDPRELEKILIEAGKGGIWEYSHFKQIPRAGHVVTGYSFVPPTPFLLKDWERYDVSRYVDPACVSPEDGIHTLETEKDELRYGTIQKDLRKLFPQDDLSNVICLFHSPPYQTHLDRAALDGKMIDHVPLDVHVGSIAIKRFIEERQPKITLHGHIHESSRLTGQWRDKIGRTHLFSAAYEGPELTIITLDLENPGEAQRLLL